MSRRNINSFYSLNNDLGVFKARNAENMARRKVNEIYQIYG